MTRQNVKNEPVSGALVEVKRLREPPAPDIKVESQCVSAEIREPRLPRLVRDLGWSEEQATDTHYRLRPFAEEWDAPEMDAYDAL
jgi:hypothetical protein